MSKEKKKKNEKSTQRNSTRTYGLQNKKEGEKEYQLENGGVRKRRKQNQDEDQQNNGLKHLCGEETIKEELEC